MSCPLRSLFPLLFAFALPAAAQTAALAPGEAPAGQPAPATDAIAVEFVQVQERPLVFDVNLTGTIAARDSIDLSFPQGGRIAEITVEAGDRVTAGQELARTDGVQQQQALAQADAGVAAAEAAEQQARQAATRAAEMLRRGVGTRAARDSAQQALSAAEGELQRARTAAAQARNAAEDTVLTAPADAVVTSRSAEPGQVVGAAQPVLRLATLSGLEAVIQVPDRPQLDSAQGASVSLRPLDRPGMQLTGKVTEIAPLVDPATGSVTIRAAIEGDLDTSLLGAAVVATVHLPAGTGIEVPWTALTASGAAPAVWRIGPDSTVSIAPVEVERFHTGRVVLKSGVAPGDTVVGEGSQLMYPGRSVIEGKPRP